MPTWELAGPSGESFQIEGDQAPTEKDIAGIVASMSGEAPTPSPEQPKVPAGKFENARDVSAAVARGELSKDEAVKMLHSDISQLQQDKPDWRSATIAGTFNLGTSAAEMSAGMAAAEAATPLAAMAEVVPVIGPAVVYGGAFALGSAAAGKVGKAGRYLAEQTDIGKKTFKEIDEAQRKSPEAAMVGEFAPQAIAGVSTGQSIINAIRRAPDDIGRELGRRVAGAAVGGGVMTAVSPIVQQVTEGKHDPITMTKFWENFAMGLTMSGDAGKEKVEFERSSKLGPIAEHMFKEGFEGRDLPTKEAIEKQFDTKLSEKEWEQLEQIHTSTEYIDQAAVKIDDKVHAGVSHPEIIEREGLDPSVRKTSASGFLTNRGRFVSREEGQTIAERANQVDKKPKGHQLWSEDIRSGRRPTTILEGLKIDNKGGGVHEVSVKGKTKTVKFLTLDQAMALPEVQAKLKEFTDKQLELKKDNPNHVIKKFGYFGHVSANKSTIFIRRNRGKTDPTFTHEMVHALEDLGIITKDQSQAVVKRFLTPEIKAEVEEFYAKEDWETEYLAHIIESWHRKGNAPKIHWLERAYDFVRRIIGLESTEKYQGKKEAESVLKAGLGDSEASTAGGEGAAKFSTKAQKEGEVFARSLETIKERIPPESRFVGTKEEGKPVLHPSGKPFLATDITSKTGSLNITQPVVDRSIDAAVKQSGPAAELAIQKLKEDGITFSPPSEKHWKDVENLPKKDRFWYETSAEAMAISFKNFGKMIPKIMDLIAATSPLADPNYNARLAISILSEMTLDKPSITPAVVPTGVADALFDRFGKAEARKIGSFGQTFRFLAGLIDEAPLSTNDRQVAASFNIPGKAFGEYPVLYEVISRFYSNLRDEINKANPNSPDGPIQTWQLQALSWVQTRSETKKTRRKKITDEVAFEGDAYAQAFKKAAKMLREAGIPIDTDRETGLPLFTPEALKNAEVSKVLSPHSEGFAKDIFQTMEIVTNLTKTGKQFADLSQKSFELGIKGNINAADAVIFRHMASLYERSSKGKGKEGEEKVLDAALEGAEEKKSAKKKKAKSILSKLAQALGNETADITRVEYGKGTFQGQLSHNIRIPLSEVPLEAGEAFLSILGEHYSQAAQAASRFVPAENNEAHDTYTVFLRSTNDLNIPEIKEFAETLSKKGHEANITSRPNGLVLDIHPAFKESGPSPIPKNVLNALVTRAFLKYSPKISGVKYDSMYIERADYKNKIEQFKRKLLNEAADSISKITGIEKKLGRNLAEGKSESGSDPLKGLSIANAKRAGRIRDTYQKRLSDIEAVRKELKAKAKAFEADMKKTLPIMEARIARQEKQNESNRLKAEASKPKFSIKSRSEIYAEHGYTEDDVAEWRGSRKEAISGQDVAGKRTRVPQVQEAAVKYYNREITQDEYNATVRLHMPIVPITKETFPEFPTNRDVISSLTPAQVEKGIVGLNLEIPDGKYVGSRLDINAYQNFDTWNVSLHDKDQSSIGYGKTAVLKDVKFETSPERAQKIAMGQPKSTFAKMFGSWQNMPSEEVYDLAHKLIDDPNWVQVGMNPFRHSWFYDKADGRPLESAKQVIQVGPLVLASKQGIKYMENMPKFSVGANPQTKTEKFKKWFGDWEDPHAFSSKRDKNKIPVSVVTDKNGPIRLFHSTDKDFTQFETGRKTYNDYGLLGLQETERHAIFATEDPEVSQEYIQGKSKASMMPVYFDIKGPLDLTKGFSGDVLEELKSKGLNASYYRNARNKWEFFDGEDGKQFVKVLKELGYDGVIFQEDSKNGASTTYAAFDPEQVKSASGNTGEFSRESKDIRFSTASEMGYKEEAIHGTVKDFTEFRPSTRGRLGGGIYVARRGDEEASIKFAKRAGLMAAVRGEKSSDPRVINLRADFGKTLNMDDLTQSDLDSLSRSIPQNTASLKYLGITPENAEASDKMLQSIHEDLRNGSFNPADLQEALGENEEGVSVAEKIYKKAGFDSISKSGKYGVEHYTETVVFDPSRLKLAQPVTYDDNGLPIPDSRRYDRTSKDIRFSAGEEPAEKPKEDPAKVKRIINKAVGVTDSIKHRETPVNVGYNIGLATGRKEAEKVKAKAFEAGRKVGVEQGKKAPAPEPTIKQRINQMAETQKTEAYHEARPLVEELQERLNGSINSLDALQAVLKAQERATQKGKAIGEKEAKENLSVAQDWLTAESRGLFTDITDYLKAALPKEYHSMFMNRINNAVIVPNLMTGNPKSMFHKVAAVAELIEIKSKEVHRQNLVSAINEAYTKALSSPTVDVGMKARIRSLLENYGMGSMSPKRRARLEETRKYVEKMDAQGLPHGVPENVMDDLELLNKVPIKELPVDVLQAIHDDILMMDKLGRLTVKSRKNIRINRANLALQDLATQKTNKWEDKEGIKPPSFGDLTGVQKLRNKITSLQNGMAFMDKVLLPVDAMMDWMDGGKGTYRGFLFKHIRNPLDRSFNLGLAMKREIMEPLREMQKKYKLTTEDAQKIGIHAITMMEDGHDRLVASGIPDADIALARKDYQNRKDYQEVYGHMRSTLDRLLPSVQKLMKEEYNLEVKPVDFYFPFLRDFSKYQPKLQESERYTKLSEVDQSGLNGFMDGLQDDYTSRLTNETQKKFTIERKKNAATPIKYNAFDIFTQHINDVTHFLASQAELKHINRLVESDVFKEKYGVTGQRMMAGWLDTYARQGRVNPDQKIKWLDWLRRNSGAGMLAFRVVSQFKHLSNVPLAVQRAGAKNYWSAMNDVVTGKADSFLKENFPETYERGGGEIGIAEVAQQSNKTLRKASELGFLLEKKIDQINAQACALGTYKRLMEEKTGSGFDYLNQPVDKKAQAEAMVLSRRAVASPSSKDVPLAISRGALTGGNVSVARSLFQFSNIMLDQWSNIRHDFIGAGILEKNPQLAGAMILAITAVIVAEDLIVTNIHDLENKILGYEPKKKESVAKSLSMEVLKRVPFANNVTSAILYGETGVPVLQLMPEFGKSVKKIGGEKRTEGIIETALTTASLMGGVGAGQAKEFYQKYRKGQNQ